MTPYRYHQAMTIPVDNRSEPDYSGKVRAISERLRSWSGPIVLATHIDPDGDAVGSALALSRALQAVGRATTVSLIPPRFLAFLTAPGEVVPQLETLSPGTLLVALDVGAASRVAGVPLGDAALTINIDHHGTNERFGDIHLVDPSKAATAQIVKDIVEQLGLALDTGTRHALSVGHPHRHRLPPVRQHPPGCPQGGCGVAGERTRLRRTDRPPAVATPELLSTPGPGDGHRRVSSRRRGGPRPG